MRLELNATCAWFMLCLLLCPSVAIAAKTDTVVLANGDAVTGEIKRLEFGKLRYSTDSMGTVMIEWDEIQRIRSDLSFTVETRSGARYFGSLQGSDTDGSVVVRGQFGTKTLPVADVVKIQQIESNLFDRIDTYFTAGYSYSKASDITNFNLGLEMTYQEVASFTRLSAFSLITDDGEEEKQSNRISLEHQGFRPKRRYWFSLIAAESNDELGLDYRMLAGGGFGVNFLQTNLQQFGMDIGLVGVQTENNDATSDSDLESLWRTRYRIFDYDTPKTDLTTTLSVFSGLTNWGEYRVNYDITLRQELIEDFFWDLSFFSRYQSDSPDDEASSTDYGISTSIGLEL